MDIAQNNSEATTSALLPITSIYTLIRRHRQTEMLLMRRSNSGKSVHVASSSQPCVWPHDRRACDCPCSEFFHVYFDHCVARRSWRSHFNISIVFVLEKMNWTELRNKWNFGA